MKHSKFSLSMCLGSLVLASGLVHGVHATSPQEVAPSMLQSAASILATILEDEPTPQTNPPSNPLRLEDPQPAAGPTTPEEAPTNEPPVTAPGTEPAAQEPAAQEPAATAVPGETTAKDAPAELPPAGTGDEPQLLSPEGAKEVAPTDSAKTDSAKTDSAKADSAKADSPPNSIGPSATKTDSSPATTVVKPAEPPLTPELLRLREKVHDCLGYYYHQHDNVAEHSPWGLMHDLIAYGVDTKVTSNGEAVNAISFLCFNGVGRGQQLFYLQNGRLETRLGPGVQGHAGQFLAMMAQSRVKADYPMNVEGKDLTIQDLIEYEKRTCEAGTELTFKLIGLAHYLDTDTQWKSDLGENWSISRLVKEELAQPIVGAACGGTHRLMGFTYAVRKREKEGKPVTGQFLRARKFLDDYFEYTFYLQNEDGSFSTDFFRGRNDYGDVNLRIETSGHILEWFVASLSKEQLRDPRVTKAVDYLATTLLRNRRNEWEIGPRGHALHALAIYSERMYGERPGSREPILARGRTEFLKDRMQR